MPVPKSPVKGLDQLGQTTNSAKQTRPKTMMAKQTRPKIHKPCSFMKYFWSKYPKLSFRLVFAVFLLFRRTRPRQLKYSAPTNNHDKPRLQV